jgi:hypothetical protein
MGCLLEKIALNGINLGFAGPDIVLWAAKIKHS